MSGLVVGLIRLELMTPALSRQCSNQLSYRPEYRFTDLLAYYTRTTCCEFSLSALVKEVIQPQVPLRLPCYDFTPVIDHTVVSALLR